MSQSEEGDGIAVPGVRGTGRVEGADISRNLVGYAVLRANFNHDLPGYVNNFMAFVTDVLAKSYPEWIDQSIAGEQVRRRFGFTIPDAVVGKLLNRVVRDGVAEHGDAGFRLIGTQMGKVPDLEADISKFGRQQDELEYKFRHFVEESTADVASAKDPKELSALLWSFIERNVVPLLSVAVRGRRDRLSGDRRRTTDPNDYLAAAFVQHLERTDNASFAYLVDAVKGAILASVLDIGVGNLSQRLTDLTLVLDTPVVLKLLGYEGEVRSRAITQTIDLAVSLRAKIVCFEHTLSEIDGVLESAQAALANRSQRRGILREVDAHLMDAGYSPADVEIQRAQLRSSLSGLRVQVIPKPDDYYKYGLDEVALEETLQRVVGYASVNTRRYDVYSLSAIHRLRHGSAPSEFEHCRYVLVTDNSKVALASTRVDERHVWPLAMLEQDLAGILWVRCPGIAEDIPRQQLIAVAYAGMQPGSHLWEKYLLEIEQLQARGGIEADEALILRSRPEARRALMEVTLGDDSELTVESLEEVLERVRTELAEPYRKESAMALRERDAALHKAEEVAVARSAELDALAVSQDRTEQLAEQVRSLRSSLHNVEVREQTRRDTIASRAAKRAKRYVRTAVGALCGILIVFGVLGLSGISGSQWLPRWASVSAIGVAAIGVTIGVVRSLVGGSVLEWVQPVERRLSEWLERRHLRRWGLTSDQNLGGEDVFQSEKNVQS